MAVGVVREPPDLGGLAGELSGTRFADLETNNDTVQALGTGVGRQLVVGGALLDQVQERALLPGQRGRRRLDALIVVRDQPDDLDSDRARGNGTAGVGADRWGHRDPGRRRGGRERGRGSILDPLLPVAGHRQRRQHRPGRRSGGDGVLAARRPGQLRNQGHCRQPAAGPARAETGDVGAGWTSAAPPPSSQRDSGAGAG